MQPLLVEIVNDPEKGCIFVHLPYKLVSTGGPPDRVSKPHFEKGDLVGPYQPGIYVLTKHGKVLDGPPLSAGTSARLLEKGSDTNPWISPGWYLVGEELPSTALRPDAILLSVRKLQKWAEHGTRSRWKEDLEEAEAAARTLGFDGLEIVEYSSHHEWTARSNRKSSFPF